MKKNDHSYSCNPELDSVDIFASDFILYISTLKKKTHKTSWYRCTSFFETISII